MQNKKFKTAIFIAEELSKIYPYYKYRKYKEKILLKEAHLKFKEGDKIKIKEEIFTINHQDFSIVNEYIVARDKNNPTILIDLFNGNTWAEIVEEKKLFLVGKYSFEKLAPLNKANVSLYNNGDWEIFESKEERDNYIKMNKPEFSRQQIIDFMEVTFTKGTNRLLELFNKHFNG